VASPDAAYDAAAPNSATSHSPYRVFNIGNRDPVPLLDFIGCIERAIGRTAEKRLLPLQDGDVLATFANTDALNAWIGFLPSTPVERGVRHFVDWYRGYYGV
jgi:UDP-glucuronate 4-epimerase